MATFDAASIGPFLRIGLVGCGRVGRTVAFAIDTGRVHVDLAAICDTNADKVQELMFQLKRPTRSMSLQGLVASVDLVIECTNRHIAPTVIMAAMNGGKDILVTNAAAVLARDDLGRLADERGLTIFVADALLTGADALDAVAATPSGTTVTLTLTCPPGVLAGAPFLRGKELPGGEGARLVFQGEARDAMAGFPMLANTIAAALIGADAAELLVRVALHDIADAVMIDLAVSAAKQETTQQVRVANHGSEAIDPEVVGLAVVGFLRSLVSPIRLA
jgi:aspartate dehydrogenase